MARCHVYCRQWLILSAPSVGTCCTTQLSVRCLSQCSFLGVKAPTSACTRCVHAAPDVRFQHAEALLVNSRHLTLFAAGPCGHDFCESCYRCCVAMQSR